MGRKNAITDATDKAIGRKIKELRKGKGWSRNQLAALVDVTHQQIQKYELGSNRISSGRIMAIAKAFGVTVNILFEDAEIFSTARDRAGIELIRNFNNLPNAGLQDSILLLMRNLNRTVN